jgi:hypothetical protein
VKITGDKELDKKLKRLATKSQKKIVRAVDSAMITVFLRGVRNAVPPKQKSAKKALGRKINKKNRKKNITETKFGFGVGKRTTSKKQRDPSKPGVGIAKENVHWLILGTGHRERDNGGSTGRMPAVGLGWLKQGVNAVKMDAENKAVSVARTKLAEEAKKP